MKHRNQNIKTVLSDKGERTWYTLNQVFKKASKKDEFHRAYQEETARIKLAQQIRNTRISKKLTQKTVAERADMPQSVIARLESGSHGVSLDTLNKVAHALGKRVQLT